MKRTWAALLAISGASPAYATECNFVMDCDVVALAELVRDNAMNTDITEDKKGTVGTVPK